MAAYPPYQQPSPPRPQVQYAPAPRPEPADSIGSWMLTILLVGIPVVGFIYVLVVAFGGSASRSKQNWARATLIWMLIAIIAVVLFAIVVALTGASVFDTIENA